MRRVVALVRFLLVTEWRMYVGAARLLARRPDVPAGATPVPYAGAVAAVLWAITAVSAVELVALHLILPWHTVRLVADILGIWGVIWCLGLTGCHYVYPHLVTDAALRVRSTRRHETVTVPWDAVAGVRMRERGIDDGSELQVADGALLVGAGKRTNVELSLSRPLSVTVRGVTHEVHEVRVFADDARALATLARANLQGGAATPS